MEHDNFFYCEICGDAEDAEDEMLNQQNEQQNINRVRTLWDTNEQFRKDIKAFQKVKRELAQPHKAYKEFVAQKKAEVAPRWALLKAQYEGLYSTKEDEIRESEQYKTYKAAYTKVNAVLYRIRARHNVSGWDFYALRSIPGCKTLRYSPWLIPRPQGILRRALRLRLGGRFRRY